MFLSTQQQSQMYHNHRIAGNIKAMLKHYQEAKLITGKSAEAINKIRKGIETFSDNRAKIKDLKHVTVHKFQDDKGTELSQVYVIKIRGRDGSLYRGKKLSFVMFVFDSYPSDAPEFYAPKVKSKEGQESFLHLNIESNGKVCMEANQKQHQYHDKTTLTDMLRGLQTMIYEPNKLSAYQSSLFHAYKTGGHKEYELLEAQAALLQDDSEKEEKDEEDDESGSDDN